MPFLGYTIAQASRPSATRFISLELQPIYILSSWHGTGVADKLMEWALTTTKAQRASELYLTVFDHDERAKRFYTRHGFEEVGRCIFKLGDRIDDDRIWRRRMLHNE
jgi:ribosomal protein S18 acetylase RimI-like enzyme